jgi:hypothetical protein
MYHSYTERQAKSARLHGKKQKRTMPGPTGDWRRHRPRLQSLAVAPQQELSGLDIKVGDGRQSSAKKKLEW